MVIRPAAVAGAFYPGSSGALKSMITGFLKDCKKNKTEGELRALIIPHAGYVYSGPIAAAGYYLISQMKQQPEKIILIGPSHYAGFYGMAGQKSERWETPLGAVKAGKIEELCGKSGLVLASEDAHAPEHSLEVQLPFLQTVMKYDFEIYPLLSNEVSAKDAAKYLGSALKDEKSFLLVSSDLSHYLPYEAARKTDEKTTRIITSLDLESAKEMDACGRMGIEIAMHVAKGAGWKCQMIDCRNSGDTAGDKSKVVGYGCYGFFEK